MKLLAAIFLCMAIYGFATHHVGGGLLALFNVGFVVYGSRQLRQRDIEYYLSPRSALVIPNTEPMDALTVQDTEAARFVL